MTKVTTSALQLDGTTVLATPRVRGASAQGVLISTMRQAPTQVILFLICSPPYLLSLSLCRVLLCSISLFIATRISRQQFPTHTSRQAPLKASKILQKPA